MARDSRFAKPLRVWFTLQGARRPLTAKELSDRLPEFSARMIYRYLQDLDEAGFPLEKEGDRWGIPSGVPIPVQLRDEEIVAMSVALRLLPDSLRAPLEALSARLESMLSPHKRTAMDEVRSLHRIVTPGQGRSLLKEDAAELIRWAILHEQVVRIEYVDPKGKASTRDLEPRGILVHQGSEHLVAHCRLRGGIRQFVLARIHRAEVLDETFEADEQFDMDDYARRAFSTYSGPVLAVEVQLDPAVAYLARERLWHATQRVEECPDRSVILRFEASGLFEIAAWVAGLGGQGRALGPPELVERVHKLHRDALARIELDNPSLSSDPPSPA